MLVTNFYVKAEKNTRSIKNHLFESGWNADECFQNHHVKFKISKSSKIQDIVSEM